jgi:hypothetical protein
LIDSEENKIVSRRGLPALALEKILVILLLPPDRGDEGEIQEEMGRNYQAGAKRTNRRYDQAPMTTKPLHLEDFRSRAGPRPEQFCTATVEAGFRDGQVLVSTQNPATLPARERLMTPR